MGRKSDLIENIQELLNKRLLSLVKDTKGNYYGLINDEKNNTMAYLIYDNDFRTALKKLYYQHFKKMLLMQEVQNAVDITEILGTDNLQEVEVCKRIYNNGSQYAYELDREKGTVVWIENGRASIETVEGVIFRHSANYADQVKPDLRIKPTRLLHYVEKNFNLKSERELKLLTLFLVTSFWGLGINHPMLVLTGEKGSSKSTTLRKLESLIDPKSTNVGGGIPKGSDGLELKLHNNYFTSLDNLSSLSRRVSDTLAVAVTGGSVSKRALYQNTNEIVLDLKSVVAVNGVSLVAKESDLLDRSLIITLKRIEPDEIVTEEALQNQFEEDRAKILGCIFKVLASAFHDKKPVEKQKLIRMADFHVACIKAGRVLGMAEEEVSEILWENQKNINRNTLDGDVVALCVMELMRKRKRYTNSMSTLLCDLQDIAAENGMAGNVLPKTPNHLRIRIDKIKSNLENESGIRYEVKPTSTFKEITIWKK